MLHQLKGGSKNSGFKFLPFLVFSVSVAFRLFLVSFCQVSSVTQPAMLLFQLTKAHTKEERKSTRHNFQNHPEKIYTFSLSLLPMFTVSLIPCCKCRQKTVPQAPFFYNCIHYLYEQNTCIIVVIYCILSFLVSQGLIVRESLLFRSTLQFTSCDLF